MPDIRNLCPTCNQRLVAVNYRRDGRTYYRSQCDHCLRAGKKLRPVAPNWFRRGYRKKDCCEKCGFKAKYPKQQLRVFYVDGDMRNNTIANLRTICLNCQQEIIQSRLPWKEAELVPDF